MSADKTSATNAKKDDAETAKKAAAAQAQQPKSQIGSAASRKPEADDDEDTGKDTASNRSAGEDDDDDFGPINRDDLMFRGILMAVLVRLPAVLAYGSQGQALNEMIEFVKSFDTREERMVVVELIKAISEVAITDIPGGGYKAKVNAAMDVVLGYSEQVQDIRDPHSSEAAAARLNMSLGGMPMPSELQALAKEANIQNGNATAEQREAAARLYGSPAPS